MRKLLAIFVLVPGIFLLFLSKWIHPDPIRELGIKTLERIIDEAGLKLVKK